MSYDQYLLGLLALHQNNYSSASVRFREYFHLDRVLEEKVSLCRFLTSMSAIAGGTDQPELCAILFGAAQMVLEGTSDFRMDPFDRAEFDRHIQIARDQLGIATFDMLSTESRTMTIDRAIQIAMETKAEITS